MVFWNERMTLEQAKQRSFESGYNDGFFNRRTNRKLVHHKEYRIGYETGMADAKKEKI